MSAKAILETFGVEYEHQGVCIGPGQWLTSTGQMIPSYNPSTGELLGKVQAADEATYQAAVDAAEKAFKSWRMVPAQSST